MAGAYLRWAQAMRACAAKDSGELGVEIGDAAAGGFAAFDPAIVVAVPIVEETADVGESRVGQREFGIDADGALVHFHGEFEVGAIYAAGVAAAAQVVVVGFDVLGGLGGDGFLFLRREGDAKSLGDGAGDFVLHFEDVFHFAVVTLGP